MVFKYKYLPYFEVCVCVYLYGRLLLYLGDQLGERGGRVRRPTEQALVHDHTCGPDTHTYSIKIFNLYIPTKNVFLLDIFKKVSFVLYPAHSRVGAERYHTHSHTNLKLNFLVINLILKK